MNLNKIRRINFLELNKMKKNMLDIINLPKVNNYFYLNNKKYSLNVLKYFLYKEENQINLKKSISILDLCVNLNSIIPHYCYHFSLSIAGNCRMCLVELTSSAKPIASCAIDILPNMKIKTNTLLVNRAREGIMEFLLVNHPLDCPVCDQGGECDLQDQSLVYGNDRGRFYHLSDYKRAITDFMFNPMIKFILTRCIFCTRCIRFLNEIEAEYNLGLLGRGSNSEIGVYVNSEKKRIISELGSNITDYCPVGGFGSLDNFINLNDEPIGALTVKTYALNYRSWDELFFESIDLSDSLCSSIRVYSNFIKIIRILPQYNTELNINWIHEKTRYLTDGLNSQQLHYPLYKSGLVIFKYNNFFDQKFLKSSWSNLTKLLIRFLVETFLKKNSKFIVLKTFIGDFLDVFTLLNLKENALSEGYNSIYSFTDGLMFSNSKLINEDFDFNYVLNPLNLSKYKNIFLIDLNLRIENPILNAKLRHKYIWDKKSKFFYLGSKYNMTYKYIHIGTTTKIFLKMVEGRNYLFNFLKRNLTEPIENLLLYSSELKKCYRNTFYRSFFNYFKTLTSFFEFNYLVQNSGTMGNLDLSINRFITRNIQNINGSLPFFDYCNYYISCNQFLRENSEILINNINRLSIYQNFMNDKYYTFADFFLPSYSFYETEKEFYINCFGILKMTKQFFFGSTPLVKDNSEIISFLYKIFSKSKIKNKVDFFKRSRVNLNSFNIYNSLKNFEKNLDNVYMTNLFKEVYNSFKNYFNYFKNSLDNLYTKIQYKEVFFTFFIKGIREIFLREIFLSDSAFVYLKFSQWAKNRSEFFNEFVIFLENVLFYNIDRISVFNFIKSPYFIKNDFDFMDYLYLFDRFLIKHGRVHFGEFFLSLENHLISNFLRYVSFLLIDFYINRFKYYLRNFLLEFNFMNIKDSFIFSSIKFCNSSTKIYNYFTRIIIKTYIPLYLYDKFRLKFFRIFEKTLFYSFVYFYLLSSKNRNFFKTNLLTKNSLNMISISDSYFSNKSNFSL